MYTVGQDIIHSDTSALDNYSYAGTATPCIHCPVSSSLVCKYSSQHFVHTLSLHVHFLRIRLIKHLF